jgi:hypothetical protein
LTRKLMLENWNSYRAEVLEPQGACRRQIDESRHLFYAGALAAWNSIMNTITIGAAPTPAELAQLAEIDGELKQYCAELWVEDLLEFAEGRRPG